MKKLFITGCNGKLSQYLISVLCKDYKIIGCDVHKASKSKNIIYYKIDLSKLKSLEILIDSLITENNFPDILINNAAIDSVPKENEISNGFDLENFEDIFHINLRAPIYLIDKISEYWIKKKISGRVINFTSIYSSVSPDPNLYDKRFKKNILYGASKSSLVNITKQMAVILIRDNIFINSISFGGIYNHQDDNFVKKYSERVPVKRMMTVDEIISSINYLLDEKNTYSVGSNIIVDGGYTII